MQKRTLIENLLLLLRLALPYWLACVFSGICMAIFALCNTVSVLGMIPLIDRVLSNKPLVLSLSIDVPFKETLTALVDGINAFDPEELLKWICIFLMIATLLKGITRYLQNISMEWVSQKIAKDLRTRLFEKFFLLPNRFYSGNRTGELITRITNDVAVIQSIYSGRFTNALMNSLHFFPFVVIVILLEWRMAFLCLVVIPLCLLPIILVGRQIRKIAHKNQENIADLSSFVHERLAALKIVKVFGQTKKEQEFFSILCDKSIRVRLKSQKKEAILSPITELIGVSACTFLLWIFAPKVLNEEMTLGTFLTYFTCIGCLMKPLNTMGRIQVLVQGAMAGIDRVMHLLDAEDSLCETKGKQQKLIFSKSYVFHDVSFSYDPETPVLKHLSFEIKKGQIVALVGPSGSGKSTIAHLIERFYDPDSGKILIDSLDMKEIAAESVREILGVVSQDPVLFNASVYENIVYGKPDTPKERVMEAARLSRSFDFIQKMDQGFDTIIGERGVRLSGGEKQRIAIARALIRDPQVFVFDEATSALDSENESLVQEAIDKVMENRTVLVIAHRLSTVRKAHQILVLNQGEIVERGTHQELISSKGLYKKLYDNHFMTEDS